MIKAVLFDFNGVLLEDRKWHEEAWEDLSKYLRGKVPNKTEIEQHIHGRTPADTLKYLLGHIPTTQESKKYLDRKENLYQKIALADKDNFKLMTGAVELFGLIDDNQIKKTIATSSPLVLINFYYKHLGLEKWFPYKRTVFGDGTFPGKPAPDIYIKAAHVLKVNIRDCLVIEDARSGVESAQKAGAGKIIFLVNDDNKETAKKITVYKMIKSLKEINIKDLQ